jgi:hypothetical protein
MNVQHVEAPSSLLPDCLSPYLRAIKNIGIIAENATRTGVVFSEAALAAAELSKAMVQLRLDEVSKTLTVRPALT